MDEKVVVRGMNAVKCVCKDGTIFIPITADMMAKLRVHGPREFKAICNNGHGTSVKLVTGKGAVAQVAEHYTVPRINP